jgi:hypothetical protein
LRVIALSNLDRATEVPSEGGTARRTPRDAILTALMRLKSEFANYVPTERRRRRVTLWATGHAESFPLAVKHQYSRT